MQTIPAIEILPLIFGLLGGLALFLYGIEQMTGALKTIAGSKMKNLLAKVTSNRIKGAITGVFATAVVQSSSVTTVLVVGFISAGLISLAQAISIIVGANVGSTVTVQIIAFNITKYSLLMIAIGFGIRFIVKNEKIKYLGLMLMGIGLLFLGMQFMSDATRPLRSYEPFIYAMSHMKNPIIGILIAAVFTAIIHSSAATIGIVIALASQGFINLEAGISLVLGANIGTCITALLASIGMPRVSKQAALSHIIINIIGVLIWLPFIYRLDDVVRYISPSFHELTGLNRIAAEAPRQIANAHTIFNIFNTIILLPFITPLGKFIAWILPVKPLAVEEKIKPKYLDHASLSTPSIALELVRMELSRQSRRALVMIKEITNAVLYADKDKLRKIKKMDDEVDLLHDYIISYLSKLSKKELTAEESRLHQSYLIASNYIEYIGDVIETNLVTLGKERVEAELQFSKKSQPYLSNFFDKVIWCAEESFNALLEGNKKRADVVINMKKEVSQLAQETQSHLEERLNFETDVPLAEYRILSEIVENMKRIYYLSKRIAKDVVESKSLSPSQPLPDINNV
ncbi:MAG: Na/Pi cotransporter family protein [Ignavibacteriaceae bacterium]|jgi:phosphate:Na+ symporter|nr:Na/Pi cotransporter family protein [Ignavibacteriaceae bacterium]MCU0414281.1 Na/Pi cotransporter family protein [Ignavibacteriaceae bacterium]